MSREAQALEFAKVAADRIVGWLQYDGSIPTAHVDCVEKADETCEMLTAFREAVEFTLTALLDAVAEEGRREGIGEAATVVLNSPLMTIGECLVLSGQVRDIAKGKP